MRPEDYGWWKRVEKIVARRRIMAASNYDYFIAVPPKERKANKSMGNLNSKRMLMLELGQCSVSSASFDGFCKVP